MVRVAEVDGRVIGWCDVERVAPGGPLDHRGLLAIAIRREFRGKGVGTALMEATLDACRRRFEIVELDVNSNNKQAIRLYKRFGFKGCGLLPGAVKRGGRYFDVEFMFLKL